jgi:hypothetical protein
VVRVTTSPRARAAAALGRDGAVAAVLGGRGGASCGASPMAGRRGVSESPEMERSGRCACEAAAAGAGRSSGEELGGPEDGAGHGTEDRPGGGERDGEDGSSFLFEAFTYVSLRKFAIMHKPLKTLRSHECHRTELLCSPSHSVRFSI